MRAHAESSGTGHPGLEWFRGAGLGIFIHWDHASQRGLEVSWPLVGRSIVPGVARAEDDVTPDEYFATAATFNPTAWDATALARQLRSAGASYAVFTAKHHGGYVMWHTKYTDFSIEHSPFRRDITRELVDALRAEGIRVGIYFTLADWHHPDYPAFAMSDRPYRQELRPVSTQPDPDGAPHLRDYHRRSSPEQWQRYLADLRGELTEILTEYGRIDLLWFDGEWERSAEEWDTAGIHDLIRSLQPDVVVNDRLLGFGDYATPEQAMPMEAVGGPWELCLTMGDSWGYREADTRLRSAASLVRTLSEVVSRGGNLLLNVGPQGDGSLPHAHVKRLEAIGEWMVDHREAVVGVDPGIGIDFYGPVSRRDGRVYLHLHGLPFEEVVARNLPVQRIASVTLLATGQALDYEIFYEIHMNDIADRDPVGEIRIAAPAPSGALLDIIAIDLRAP